MNSIKIMVIQKFKIEEEIMNFEESNQFVEQMEKNNKNKKNVLIVLVICAIIVVILFGVIGYIRQKDTEVNLALGPFKFLKTCRNPG